mmetsp:Transcript_36013/g.75311  ORF Transcript_36013/g.75311 Transcript_36013/m.75311 type:complete len:330 (-) Transcript_36013:276-1265(-)
MVLLRVDLGVKPGVADQVHDPELRLLLAHVELVREHGNVDALVDAAVRLEDEEPRALDELILQRLQEVVRAQEPLALAQLLLRAVEVVVDQQAFNKLCDRITVGVVLLLNDPHKILEHVSSPRVGYHGGREVAEHVRAVRLDGLHVTLGEEEIDNFVTSVRICRHFRLEEYKEAPVYQPGSLLQLLKGICELPSVYNIPQLLQIVYSIVPLLQQNLSSQFPPQRRERVVRGRVLDKHAVHRQELCSSHLPTRLNLAIVTTLKMKLCVLVQRFHLLRSDFVGFNQRNKCIAESFFALLAFVSFLRPNFFEARVFNYSQKCFALSFKLLQL